MVSASPERLGTLALNIAVAFGDVDRRRIRPSA
jgi:hypothetical protein